MVFLSNSFSLQMVASELPAYILVEPVFPEDVPDYAISVIGYPSTANLVSKILGRPLVYSRVSIKLTPLDTLYVAQYTGPRLPAGTTELPEGAEINFYRVRLG